MLYIRKKKYLFIVLTLKHLVGYNSLHDVLLQYDIYPAETRFWYVYDLHLVRAPRTEDSVAYTVQYAAPCRGNMKLD